MLLCVCFLAQLLKKISIENNLIYSFCCRLQIWFYTKQADNGSSIPKYYVAKFRTDKKLKTEIEALDPEKLRK